MPTLTSPLAPNYVLDPDQGGTGLSLTGVAAGLILVTDGANGFLLSSPLVKAPVTYASAAVLPNAPNYLNGADGVGATLTATVNAALVVDGFTPTAGMRIGVINQASTLQNGIYTVTVVGTAGSKWVLTRATDCDTSVEILPGMSFNVAAGTANAGDTFVLTTPAPITVGTTGLVFVQGSPTGYLLAANNLSDVANATTAIANLGVINGVLTGYVSGSGTIAATDTILQAIQKLNGNDALLAPLEVTANSQSANYTTVLSDSGKSIDHPSTDANARTFTIDSNANVAYPIGTCISFSNMTANVVSIAITSDTLYLAGPGTTGTRSLAQYGIATARKLTSTTWIIGGTGLS